MSERPRMRAWLGVSIDRFRIHASVPLSILPSEVQQSFEKNQGIRVEGITIQTFYCSGTRVGLGVLLENKVSCISVPNILFPGEIDNFMSEAARLTPILTRVLESWGVKVKPGVFIAAD